MCACVWIAYNIWIEAQPDKPEFEVVDLMGEGKHQMLVSYIHSSAGYGNIKDVYVCVCMYVCIYVSM